MTPRPGVHGHASCDSDSSPQTAPKTAPPSPGSTRPVPALLLTAESVIIQQIFLPVCSESGPVPALGRPR